MATFMAIDETSGLLRDDTNTALPSALDTNLTSLLGAGYNSTIVEKAVKATGFNFGANVTDLALTGTGGAKTIRLADTYSAFRRQLLEFIHFAHTGESSYAFAETIELMCVLIAGLRSRGDRSRRVPVAEVEQELFA